jgi:hypothetical protein
MIFRSLRIKNFVLKLKKFETTNKKRREGIERKRKREKILERKKLGPSYDNLKNILKVRGALTAKRCLKKSPSLI